MGELTKRLEGEVSTSLGARRSVSRDASIYEVLPDIVIEPAHTADVEKLVKLVRTHKALFPKLAITPRGAGTDMSGGALGSSIVLDMTTHFTEVSGLRRGLLHVQPGVYLRTLDPLLTQHKMQLGFAPASRNLCTIGGVVGNNAGGERSLRYGTASHAVRALEVVLADGHSYTLKPLTKAMLTRKLAEKTYEASLYRQLYMLIETHYDVIHNARPRVARNSMGYNLWDVWDRETGIFDITQLFTGSQGTLGIITDVTLETVPQVTHSGLLLVYLNSVRQLDTIIDTINAHNPLSLEGFDDISFSLGLRHAKTFRAQLGTKNYLRQQAHLSKSVAQLKGRIPPMLLMVELDGTSQQEVLHKISRLHDDLKPYKLRMDIAGDEESSAPFRQMRRATRSLIYSQIQGRHAAPFIDDFAVPTHALPKFIPKLRKIIRTHKLPVTIQGHFGDGTFHVVPLMDLNKPVQYSQLESVMRELIPLVRHYRGTMAGEHNDGMVRGPWLPAVFGQEVYGLFRRVKEIFDPEYIFNPHTKTDASWEYSASHVRNQLRETIIKKH